MHLFVLFVTAIAVAASPKQESADKESLIKLPGFSGGKSTPMNENYPPYGNIPMGQGFPQGSWIPPWGYGPINGPPFAYGPQGRRFPPFGPMNGGYFPYGYPPMSQNYPPFGYVPMSSSEGSNSAHHARSRQADSPSVQGFGWIYEL